jgi:ABC-type dipeptide/oligopeptide/nickel transport system ATPase subunit
MRIHVSNTYDDHILQDLIKHMNSTNIVFMHDVKCVANICYCILYFVWKDKWIF